MVGPFIEALMGEVGRQILYFYRDNALVINVSILIYGVIMFAAWQNLVRIYRFLIVEMAKAAHTSEELNRKKSNKKIRKIIGIPWEKAVEQSPIPLIAMVGDLIPKRNTTENLQGFFDEKDLADKTLKALQGAKIQKMMPSSRKILKRRMELRKAAAEVKDTQGE